MIKQGTEPNSKKKFLVITSEEKWVTEVFPTTLYQIQNVSFTPEEDEALSDCGAEVTSGETEGDDAVINILKHRIPLVAHIGWDKKVIWSKFE